MDYKIVSLNFSGVGGPHSGEMTIVVRPIGNQADPNADTWLRAGWADNQTPRQTAMLIEKWKTLLDAYAREKLVTLTILTAPSNSALPEIISVHEAP